MDEGKSSLIRGENRNRSAKFVSAKSKPHVGERQQSYGTQSADYEVEYDPHAVREGHDPQLEKAVAVVMDLPQKNPPPPPPHHPTYLNYHKGDQ